MNKTIEAFSQVDQLAKTMDSVSFTKYLKSQGNFVISSPLANVSILDIILKVDKEQLNYGELTYFIDGGCKYLSLKLDMKDTELEIKAYWSLQTPEAIKDAISLLLAPILLSGLGSKICIGNNKADNAEQSFEDLFNILSMTSRFVKNKQYYIALLEHALRNSEPAARIARTPENNEKLYTLLFEL
tara:strand:+ start:4266 stop:4823 length:558 start_codon:yes stop_codon:yes gene_type:complete